MDETLARHAFPGSFGGDAFGSRAAPEEGVVFLGEGRVWSIGRRVVFGFVHVVPCARVEDVVEAVGFALAEDGDEVVGCFEGGRAEVQAVEVGHVGLVADVGGEGPVLEEWAEGVRGYTGRAEVTVVPDPVCASFGSRRAADGSVFVEGVCEGAVFEAGFGDGFFRDSFPT